MSLTFKSTSRVSKVVNKKLQKNVSQMLSQGRKRQVIARLVSSGKQQVKDVELVSLTKHEDEDEIAR